MDLLAEILDELAPAAEACVRGSRMAAMQGFGIFTSQAPGLTSGLRAISHRRQHIGTGRTIPFKPYLVRDTRT